MEQISKLVVDVDLMKREIPFVLFPFIGQQDFVWLGRTADTEHFFATASAHLREGGVFTYLTNEIDTLSRAHQRLLFRHFRKIEIEVVGPLAITDASRDDLWGSSMVVVAATK
jgi:hypothetical protein